MPMWLHMIYKNVFTLNDFPYMNDHASIKFVLIAIQDNNIFYLCPININVLYCSIPVSILTFPITIITKGLFKTHICGLTDKLSCVISTLLKAILSPVPLSDSFLIMCHCQIKSSRKPIVSF